MTIRCVARVFFRAEKQYCKNNYLQNRSICKKKMCKSTSVVGCPLHSHERKSPPLSHQRKSAMVVFRTHAPRRGDGRFSYSSAATEVRVPEMIRARPRSLDRATGWQIRVSCDACFCSLQRGHNFPQRRCRTSFFRTHAPRRGGGRLSYSSAATVPCRLLLFGIVRSEATAGCVCNVVPRPHCSRVCVEPCSTSALQMRVTWEL